MKDVFLLAQLPKSYSIDNSHFQNTSLYPPILSFLLLWNSLAFVVTRIFSLLIILLYQNKINQFVF